MPQSFTSNTLELKSESDNSIDSGLRNIETNQEIPISLFKELKGYPYSVKYFDFMNFHESGDLNSIQTIKNGLNVIENYIQLLIETRGLNDNIESYTEIMDGIIDKLNISKNSRNDDKFLKVVNYIKLKSKVSKEDLKRKYAFK